MMHGSVLRFKETGRADLGPLELAVMQVLWKINGACTVNDVLLNLAGPSRYAYTTIMTTLNRLLNKGLVDRKFTGRQGYYTVNISEKQWQMERARMLVAMLLEAHGQQDQDALISGIVEGIDSEDVLNDLERCVRKRRCQLPYT